jgi:phage tail-like protein
MLFRKNTGRYLWLKLALSTVDENLSPSINHMKVLYPRESYLRYLPAIYQENPIGQEDPVSRDFLERFLSIFETVFYDFETRIYDIFKYFDPDTAEMNIYEIYKYLDYETAKDKSKDFLNWLASWFNIAVEDEWDENIKRRFIRDAYKLYKQKGTLSGIEKLIEIYTGKKPLIREPSLIGKPMILTKKGTFSLGINSLLLKTPVRGFRLGEDSIIGMTALIDGDIFKVSGDPFSSTAHWFMVVLDISPRDNAFDETMLRKILDREKPAHTMYNLIFTDEMKARPEIYVGMNTKVLDQEHFILGDNSIIGSRIIIMGGEHAGKVERRSKVEKDTELT